MDISDKVYLELKPKERMRLALSAAARLDGAEIDRLVQTCPQKTYRMPDADFTFPLRQLVTMGIEHQGRVATNMVSAATIMFLIIGFDESELPPVDEKHPPVDVYYDKLRSIIKARMEAWTEFCRADLQLSDSEAKAFSGVGEETQLGPMLQALALDQMEANADVRSAYLAELRAAWEQVTT